MLIRRFANDMIPHKKLEVHAAQGLAINEETAEEIHRVTIVVLPEVTVLPCSVQGGLG